MNLRVRIVQDVFDISSEFRASSKGGSVATRGRREAHETIAGEPHTDQRRGPAPIAPTARFGETRATFERRASRQSERHVQGCVRRTQGGAGAPLSPVPDEQGERGGEKFLDVELQTLKGGVADDAGAHSRGERARG